MRLVALTSLFKEASSVSFSFRALSSEWTFPRREAITAPLPLALDPAWPPLAPLETFFFLVPPPVLVLLASDRVASLDYGGTNDKW